jgi:hypothetical protein
MNRLTAIGMCMLTVWMASVSLQAADKVEVHQKLPPGTYLLTEIDRDASVTKIGETENKADDTSTTVWELAVGKADDKGVKKVVARVVRLAKKGAEGGKDASYDTDKAMPSAQAFVFKPLMAATVTLTFDSEDCVLECSGLDKLWESLAGKAANDADKTLLVDYTMSMTDKIMEQHFRQIETMMPKNAVSKGQSWMASMRMDLPLIGEVKTMFNCKLSDADATNAVIDGNGTHETSRKTTFTIMGTTATLTQATVQDTFRIEVDQKSSMLRSESTQRKGEVTLTVKDEKGKDVNVVIHVDNQIDVTLLPKGAPATPDTPTAASGPAKPTGKPVIPGLE